MKTILLACSCLALALVMPGAAAARQGDVFEPIPRAECQHIQALAEKALKTRFSLTPNAPFLYMTGDAENERDEAGRGCLLIAKGTGRDFPKGPAALDLKLRQAFQGWTVTDSGFYGNYDTSGGRSALTQGDRLLVIEAGWEPTTEAEALAQKKCPQSPIDACVKYFKPTQLLYTVKVHVARRMEAHRE